MTLKSDEMVAIDVREFITGTQLPTDVFMRLGNDKFVLIAKSGDKCQQLTALNAISKNQVGEVYVKKSEYTRFVNQTLEIISFVQKNKKFRNEHKAYFLRSATQAVFKQLENFGPSAQVVNYARSISDKTIDLVESQTTLSDIIRGLQMSAPDVFNLSVAISAFSVMIARQMGWQSKVTIEKLALGGLLCDIGLKELPPEIVNKPRNEMTYDEVQLYEEHPYRGMKILESVGNISDDILSIVYEHHENSAGMGYPRKLRDLRQNPLAKIVALSAEFCELVVKTPKNENPRSVSEAISQIETIQGQPYNREAFFALKSLVESDHKKSSAA